MKKEFFIDVIRKAPTRSLLEIEYWNNDLEEYLPSLLDHPYELDIDSLGKDFLIEKIKVHPIEELITHSVLLNKDHVLLKSFDTFELVQLSKMFNFFKQSDYPNISISLLSE